jgi:hypothetical protein
VGLVREPDGVPLAITLAAAYISRLTPRITPLRYACEFRRSDATPTMLLEQGVTNLRRDADVPHAVDSTWGLLSRQLVA